MILSTVSRWIYLSLGAFFPPLIAAVAAARLARLPLRNPGTEKELQLRRGFRTRRHGNRDANRSRILLRSLLLFCCTDLPSRRFSRLTRDLRSSPLDLLTDATCRRNSRPSSPPSFRAVVVVVVVVVVVRLHLCSLRSPFLVSRRV